MFNFKKMPIKLTISIFVYVCLSSDMPKMNFSVELDAAKATWLSHDVAMFSSKTGELLLLTLVYDGR